MLDLDPTYFVQLVLFLTALVALNVILFRPFMELFAERRRRVEGAVQEAERLLAEARAKAAAFEDELKRARERGAGERDRARALAEAALAAEVAAHRARLTRDAQAALADLNHHVELVRTQLAADARRLAESALEKLLGRKAA